MTKTFKYLAACTLPLAGMAFAANAVTQGEIDAARNECRQHKLMVQSKGSFARDQDKRAWEEACGRATAKMDELNGLQPQAQAALAHLQSGGGAATGEAAATGEVAAFEAPVPATTSAYHHFSQENLKRQAASGGAGTNTASIAPTPAVPAAAAPAEQPAEQSAEQSADQPAEQSAETAPAAPASSPEPVDTAATEAAQAPQTDRSGSAPASAPEEPVLAPQPEAAAAPAEEEEEAPYIPPGP